MSFPTLPDVHLCGGILREDALNLILASIAFEELGLGHLINAEAEKIQSVLGTLEGQHVKEPSLAELIRIDHSVENVLKNVISKEMLLQFKLEAVTEALLAIPPCDPSNPVTLPKYVDRVPIPGVLEPKSRDPESTFYEVTMREVKQKLHRCIPETTVWGYEGSYPGPTIEARRGERVKVRWVNDLPATHLLPVDKTLHGAEEPPNPEVRTVVHLHDSVVPPDSDGHPDAWFTRGFAEVGKNWVHEIYEYPNNQQATTLWYHDHALGITRLNVYAGLAAFYLLRDEVEDSLNIPKGQFEIPLVIQDRSFNADDSLFYPTQPDPPVNVNPSVVPEFFGDAILVNGKVWPFLEVEPRKYRFRFLNGSQARFYNLMLETGQSFFQIGTDGGFLESPVEVTEILLAPAERADVIIDFTNYKGQCILLTNNAKAPFPGVDAPEPNPNTVGQIMQFRVTLPLSGPDTTEIPPFLTTIERLNPAGAPTRDLTLEEQTDDLDRLLLLLNGMMWDEEVTEKPILNTIEVWRLINLTMDTHPIHLHLVQFQILDRQPFNVNLYEATHVLEFTGPAIPPDPNENGWKDTVRANPGEVTRIIARFGPFAGDYVWHCHILEHEDHDMMRPYIIEVIP